MEQEWRVDTMEQAIRYLERAKGTGARALAYADTDQGGWVVLAGLALLVQFQREGGGSVVYLDGEEAPVVKEGDVTPVGLVVRPGHVLRPDLEMESIQRYGSLGEAAAALPPDTAEVMHLIIGGAPHDPGYYAVGVKVSGLVTPATLMGTVGTSVWLRSS